MTDIGLADQRSDSLEMFIGIMFFVVIIFLILFTIGLFGVFRKRGISGWKAIIPIYNLWILFELVQMRGWLALIPVVNIFMLFYALFKLGKLFGKDTVFSVLTSVLSPIFLLILGYSKEEGESIESSYEDYSYDSVKDKNENIEVPSLSQQIKESEKIEEEPIPNIKEEVSPDPLRSDNVNPDPLKTSFVNPKPTSQEPKETVIESAFNMPLPKEEIEKAVLKETETLNIDSSNIETLDIENNDFVNLNKTQKFCPICGNPNDVLNKFCISCGYNFES